MDKIREEFEKYLTERIGEGLERFTNKYALDAFWLIWEQAWQASRQALVVELPRMPYYDFDVDEIETALDAVGVKYVWVNYASEGK